MLDQPTLKTKMPRPNPGSITTTSSPSISKSKPISPATQNNVSNAPSRAESKEASSIPEQEQAVMPLNALAAKDQQQKSNRSRGNSYVGTRRRIEVEQEAEDLY